MMEATGVEDMVSLRRGYVCVSVRQACSVFELLVVMLPDQRVEEVLVVHGSLVG